MKRICSLLLALVMMVGLFPVTAKANELDNGVQYEVYSDHVEITGYTGDAAEVVIPDEIEGLPVTSIGYMAFNNCSSLTNIDLPVGLTSIGYMAFNNCTSLTSIILPDGVTKIDSYAFNSCSSLTGIVIPDSVTTIDSYAFEYCSNLTSISIPAGVTRIGYCAFKACSSLSEIHVDESNPNYFSDDRGVLFNKAKTRLIQAPGALHEPYTIPGSVTTIEQYAFWSCSSLTSVVIPDSVTSIASTAFYNCSSLTSIDLPEGLTSIGYATFYYCSSLTSIDLPDSVTSIGSNAFSGCSSLTGVVIPDSVTSIGSNAFSGCSSLTSIDLPDSITSIDSSTFSGCSSLTGIDLPDSVTSIGGSAFSRCTSLTSIVIPNSVTSIGSGAFSGCSSLTSIAIPDGVTSVDGSTFSGCSSLTSIAIPDAVTYIGGSTFSGCSSLTSIAIPDAVTYIGNYAFEGCTSLTSISIPDGVTYIGSWAFYGCSSLTGISVPADATEIGYYAFRGCSSMSEIHVDENNPNYSSDDRGVLFNKAKTKLIQVPGGLRCSYTIPDSVTVIENYAFEGCSNLTGIHANDSNPNYSSDDRGVLFDKAKTRLVLAPGAIADSYTVPDGVTHIGSYAFSGCANLTSIVFPASVTYIGPSAFNGCSSLSSIYFEGDSLDSFHDGFDLVFGGVTATAYYPAGNPTWTADVLRNYGGDITWVAYGSTAPVNPFTDVPAGAWYEAPVLWALENGVTSGTSDTTFSPGNQCLRAHVVTFLWNAEKCPEPAATASSFTDVPAGAWYEKPVLWAVENGITSGVSPTKFGAGDVCSRYQVVFFLWKAAGSPEPTTTENPFTDVNSGHFFYKAVLWAVENGITSGTSDTTFSPTQPCNRAQVVTFLYAAYN